MQGASLCKRDNIVAIPFIKNCIKNKFLLSSPLLLERKMGKKLSGCVTMDRLYAIVSRLIFSLLHLSSW